MSHQVLARKWRPTSFPEVVGQEHVVRALSNALDQQRLHHAFLFTGTRGVGKTTLARILSRCFNCETGPTSTPCGTCVACREITEGRHVDLLEVDAASQTKVEQTRELLENAQYAPARGRFKIYLIDEVHMLSRSSFNALLKTLEEPPAHVKFLLATTDPQKLPVTVLSRCLQFNLRNLPADQIQQQLRKVLEGEDIQAEDEALWCIARAADGSLRDALSLTDQAIAYGDGALQVGEVRDMLGAIDADLPWRALQALQARDGAGLLALVEQAAGQGANFESLIDEVLECLHRVSVCQVVPEYATARPGSDPREAELAASLPAQDVQLFYQIGLLGRRDLPLAPEPRIGLEMTFLRMLAFLPVADSAAVVANPPGQSQQAAPVPPVASSAPDDVKKKTAELAATPQSVAAPGRAEAPAPALRMSRPAPSAPMTAVAPDAFPPSPEPATPVTVRADPVHPAADAGGPDAISRTWLELYPRLELLGVSDRLVSECGVRECTPQRVILRVPEAHAGLVNDTRREEIRQALRAALGPDLRLELETTADGVCSPAGEVRRITALRKAEAVSALERDPIVHELRDRLGAQIKLDTVQPATDSRPAGK